MTLVTATSEIARPRTTTSDRMLAECAHISCGQCRAVLIEMQGAIKEGEDTDGWWRDQFKQAHTNVTAGVHIHAQR